MATFAASGLLLLALLPQALPVVSMRDLKGQHSCPEVPTLGHLVLRSVESENGACRPGTYDDVGSSIYACWQTFSLRVDGCEVRLLPNPDAVTGPGRMPCRYFRMVGNLTGDGTSALVWADVDGPGLLQHFKQDPQAVAALRFSSARALLLDAWAYLRTFTADERFADVSWLDGYYSNAAGRHGGAQGVGPSALGMHQEAVRLPQELEGVPCGPDATGRSSLAEHGVMRTRMSSSITSSSTTSSRHRAGATVEAEANVQGEASDWEGDRDGGWDAEKVNPEGEGAVAQQGLRDAAKELGVGGGVGLGKGGKKPKPRHGPAKAYRPDRGRVVLKMANGCKYTYAVDPSSSIFDPPSRTAAQLTWRTVALTVAAISVVLTVAGTVACVYVSHRHAEYLNTYYEYQAVKEQLGSELPPATYQRIFGEPPKREAAAAAAAPAAAAAGTRKKAAAAKPAAAAAAAAAESGPSTASAAGAVAAPEPAEATAAPPVVEQAQQLQQQQA